MLKDIVEVRCLSDYRVHLRFEDGVEGELDLSSFVSFDGIFEPLKDPNQFKKVRVHPELGTIHWPNGADLDPDVLYSKLTGKPVSAN
jgi:hypothetical protein